MVEAPSEKPDSTLRVTVIALAPSNTPSSWKTTKRPARPSTPRPTTVRPMTAPPENAIPRAALRLVRAAAAVRTFALVATRMPMKPARPEHTAPTTNATAISQWLSAMPALLTASKMATATTTMASTLYSRERNAIAPSRIASAISCILSSPASAFDTDAARIYANNRASTAAPSTA